MDPAFYLDSQDVLRCSVLERIPWIDHGFGTRRAQNWSSAEIRTLHQVHSSIVVTAGAEPGKIGEGDALVSDTPGARLGIRTADCLPILIADRNRRVVAAIHAGWRGTVLEIAQKTVDLLQREFNCEPGALLIAIGPGIGPCCFEVGPEVARQFQPLFPERTDLDTRTKLDLAEANRRQLCQNGIPREQIVSSAECTFCNAALYESYRRDRELSGRMVSLIGFH